MPCWRTREDECAAIPVMLLLRYKPAATKERIYAVCRKCYEYTAAPAIRRCHQIH